jgi:succinoglycan biosynthesis transport protein ExoP
MTALVPPSAAVARSEEGMGALQLWQSTRKHWVMVLAIAGAVAMGTTLFSLGQKRQYRSMATVLIDPNPPRPLGKDVEKVVDYNAYWSNKEYYSTQIEIIQSRQIAMATVERLGLNRNRAFIEDLPPGRHGAPIEITVAQAAGVLRGRLAVEAQAKTRILEISYRDADPERSARILTALVETYIQHNLDELAASSQSASDWLRKQLAKLTQELENSELALHQYKKERSLLSVSYDDQSNMLRGEIGQLNEKLTTLRADQTRAQSRYDVLAAIDPTNPLTLPTSELLGNARLEALRGQFVDSERERARLMGEGKGEQHPDVLAVVSGQTLLKDATQIEVNNIKAGVRKDLEAIAKEVGGLNRLYQGAEHQAMDLNMNEIEYKRLERLKDNNEHLYSLLLERSKESDLAALMQVNNVRVLDPPLGGAPLGLSTPLMAALGLLTGLALGIGAAIGRDTLDRSLKTPEDVERELGVSLLGVLPRAGGQGQTYGRRRRRRPQPKENDSQVPVELSAHTQPTGSLAEAARAIRTNILFMAPDRPYRTLLITSAGPGEGKTTVACSIAIAMAQAGHRVLLVDCDLRRPRVHKVFGRNTKLNVGQAVLDKDLPTDDTLATDVPGLHVLTAENHLPNPAELLGSESFSHLLKLMGERYDRVVVDSPPVAAVTDAIILSTRVDATILVARAFTTSRDVARRAVRAIHDVGGHLAGTVLNAADGSRGGGGYYYYYYYSGNYSQTPAEQAEGA